MENTARLFNCAHCQCQVTICSYCDRGNRYCSATCSKAARQAACRKADQDYQQSFQGRRKHAERQRRYRERQRAKNKKKVTDQGSADLPPNDLLPPDSQQPKVEEKKHEGQAICDVCGRHCSSFLRRMFLHQVTLAPVYPFSLLSLGP